MTPSGNKAGCSCCALLPRGRGIVMVGKQPYPASKSLSFQNWYSMKSKGEWMDEEMRMRQSKRENPPNELLGRKCSPSDTSAEVASFSQGFLLSLGTSAELHLCQLDVSYDIGICRERTHKQVWWLYNSLWQTDRMHLHPWCITGEQHGSSTVCWNSISWKGL